MFYSLVKIIMHIVKRCVLGSEKLEFRIIYLNSKAVNFEKMLERFDYLGLLQERNLYINFVYINTFVHDLRNF